MARSTEARPDVKAVVHNHSPSVVPFSVTTIPLRPALPYGGLRRSGCSNFEIRDAAKGTDLLVKTPYLGAGARQDPGKSPAALMRATARSPLARACRARSRRSVYLELSARMQLQAIAIAGPGGKIVYLDDSEIQASSRRRTTAAPGEWRAKALAGIKS